MKRHNQTGSTHVVVAGILVVALLGALGFIFYQNFIVKNTSKTANTSNAADTSTPAASNTPVQPATAKTACSEQEKLCFTYPVSWKATVGSTSKTFAKDGSTIKQDNVTLTPNNGDMTLFLTNTISQIGGSCDPASSTDNFETIESYKTALTVSGGDYSTPEVYAIKAIIKSDTGRGYEAGVMLTNLKLVESVGNHGPCVMYASVIPAKNTSGYGDMQFTNDKFGGDPPAYVASRSDALNKLNTTSYKEAFEILKSVHY